MQFFFANEKETNLGQKYGTIYFFLVILQNKQSSNFLNYSFGQRNVNNKI